MKSFRIGVTYTMMRPSSRERRFRRWKSLFIAVFFLGMPTLAQQPAPQAKTPKNPVAGLLAMYPKDGVPAYIIARVRSVFNHPERDNEDYRAVSEAMGVDVSIIEGMTTDETLLLHQKEVLERRERILPAIKHLRSLPEKEIDIWTASLILAKDADPNLDTVKLNREFDVFVQRAGELAKARDDPDYHVRALNTFIYKRWGIGYDKTDYTGKKLINRYAYGVLTTKKGSCLNLAIFYIAVAQRLGFPVYAVAAPQHLFARYVDPRLLRQNIEPTGGGGFSPDEDYIFDMDVSDMGVRKGTYMRTLTNRELVGIMIADHAGGYYATRLGHYATALMMLDRALDMNPRDADSWWTMGAIYHRWAFQEAFPKMRETKFTRSYVFNQKARRMGAGRPLSPDYWKKPQRSLIKRGPGV